MATRSIRYAYVKISHPLPWFAVLLLALQPLLALAVPSATAPAATTTAAPPPAPNWYDVELIVFANTGSQAGAQESWPADPGVPDWSTAVPLKAAASDLPYMQLPASSYVLNADWKKLQHSSDYAPLLHVAWAQPAIDRTSALFVQVGAPNATSASVAATATVAASPETNTPDNVYGIARLSTTGPYLHFDIDLLYCGPPAKHLIAAAVPPATTAPSIASMPAMAAAMAPICQPYRLTQGRKLDAGKLNYFDNPMFGALVLITPRAK